jgi:hypothetical protein
MSTRPKPPPYPKPPRPPAEPPRPQPGASMLCAARAPLRATHPPSAFPLLPGASPCPVSNSPPAAEAASLAPPRIYRRRWLRLNDHIFWTGFKIKDPDARP